MDHYTDNVKECIHCYEQSSAEHFAVTPFLANEFESRIFQLFMVMTDGELDCYRAKLVELGYVDASEYSRSDNGLVKALTNGI